MSVVNYKVLNHHYKDEWGEHLHWVTKKAKRREEAHWRKEVQEELWEMEQEDE